MAPSAPSTTTQISKVELPAWVEKASEDNYRFAQQVANKPLQQYAGPTVAGVGQGTQDAWNTFYGTLGTGQTQYNAASDALQGITGTATPTMNASTVAGMDLSQYMNPYIDTVVNNAMSDLDRSRQMSINSNADAATAARAFGGSRQALTDAVTNAESARAAGTLSGQLRSAGFDKAMEAATGDANRTQSAAGANQAAAMQKMGLDATAAQGLLATGNAMNQGRLQDVAGLNSIGQQQQFQGQREIDANVARFNEARDYDVNRLNILLSSLGMSPYGKTETTNKTQQTGSSFDPFTGGLGLLSLFMGMSDRNEKTDIKRVGTNEETGIPIYSYRYKGDPKNYPKIVGPMAQDVEKVFPDAVREIGGKKMVNMGILASLTEGA